MGDMRTDSESCDWCGAVPGLPCLAADGKTPVQAHYRGLEPRRLPPHPARVREDAMWEAIVKQMTKMLGERGARDDEDQMRQQMAWLAATHDVMERKFK